MNKINQYLAAIMIFLMGIAFLYFCNYIIGVTIDTIPDNLMKTLMYTAIIITVLTDLIIVPLLLILGDPNRQTNIPGGLKALAFGYILLIMSIYVILPIMNVILDLAEIPTDTTTIIQFALLALIIIATIIAPPAITLYGKTTETTEG